MDDNEKMENSSFTTDVSGCDCTKTDETEEENDDVTYSSSEVDFVIDVRIITSDSEGHLSAHKTQSFFGNSSFESISDTTDAHENEISSSCSDVVQSSDSICETHVTKQVIENKTGNISDGNQIDATDVNIDNTDDVDEFVDIESVDNHDDDGTFAKLSAADDLKSKLRIGFDVVSQCSTVKSDHPLKRFDDVGQGSKSDPLKKIDNVSQSPVIKKSLKRVHDTSNLTGNVSSIGTVVDEISVENKKYLFHHSPKCEEHVTVEEKELTQTEIHENMESGNVESDSIILQSDNSDRNTTFREPLTMDDKSFSDDDDKGINLSVCHSSPIHSNDVRRNKTGGQNKHLTKCRSSPIHRKISRCGSESPETKRINKPTFSLVTDTSGISDNTSLGVSLLNEDSEMFPPTNEVPGIKGYSSAEASNINVLVSPAVTNTLSITDNVSPEIRKSDDSSELSLAVSDNLVDSDSTLYFITSTGTPSSNAVLETDHSDAKQDSDTDPGLGRNGVSDENITTEVKSPEARTPEITTSAMKITETGTHEMNIPEIRTSEMNALETSTPGMTSEMRINELNTPEMTTSEMKILETGTPETSTPEIRTPETSTPEIRTPEIRTPETSTPEIRTPEIRTPEMRTPEIRTPETSTPEIRTPETRTPEIRTPETSTSELRIPEMTASEMRIPELNIPDSSTPGMTTSEMKISELNTPELNTPETSTPDITTSEMTLPELNTSEISTPEIGRPEMTTSEMKILELNTPETSTPEIRRPETNTPEMSTCEISTPEMTASEMKIPELNTPEMTASEMKIPEMIASEMKIPEMTASEMNTPPEMTKPEMTTASRDTTEDSFSDTNPEYDVEKNNAFINEQLLILNSESSHLNTSIHKSASKESERESRKNKHSGKEQSVSKKSKITGRTRKPVKRKLEELETVDSAVNICENSPNDDSDSDSTCLLKIDEKVSEDEDIDEKLEKNAKEKGLTATNVKNILHHLITNDDVVDMVKNSVMEGMTDDERDLVEAAFEPKMTRAAVRKAIETGQVPGVWPISPVKKKTKPSILDMEFPEDEDDDEYNPENDVEAHDSDDDESIMSSQISDLGSPCTPAPSTPTSNVASVSNSSLLLSQEKVNPMISCSSPDNTRSLQLGEQFRQAMESVISSSVVENDGTIAERTRSKLPLNDTSLLAMEEALCYVAPDITPDMYDTYCDDSDWQEFIRSLIGPEVEQHDPVESVDDEATDPEYDYLAEADTMVTDPEDFRFDKPFRVSKKELNELIDELHLLFPETEEEDERSENSQPEVTAPRPLTVAEMARTEVMSPHLRVSLEQKLMIEDHMRKHIQLTCQMYVLCLGSEDYQAMVPPCVQILRELELFRTVSVAGMNSSFNVCNLPPALELIDGEHSWNISKEIEELSHDDTATDSEIDSTDSLKSKTAPKKLGKKGSLLMSQKDILWNSPVFLYPHLVVKRRLLTQDEALDMRLCFTPAEDNLIALGMEQFHNFMLYCKYIQKYMMPCKSSEQISIHIKNLSTKKAAPNPIKYYRRYKKPPDFPFIVDHFTSDRMKAPKDQDISLLPPWCRKYRDFLRRELKAAKAVKGKRKKRSSSLSFGDADESTPPKRSCHSAPGSPDSSDKSATTGQKKKRKYKKKFRLTVEDMNKSKPVTIRADSHATPHVIVTPSGLFIPIHLTTEMARDTARTTPETEKTELARDKTPAVENTNNLIVPRSVTGIVSTMPGKTSRLLLSMPEIGNSVPSRMTTTQDIVGTDAVTTKQTEQTVSLTDDVHCESHGDSAESLQDTDNALQSAVSASSAVADNQSSQLMNSLTSRCTAAQKNSDFPLSSESAADGLVGDSARSTEGHITESNIFEDDPEINSSCQVSEICFSAKDVDNVQHATKDTEKPPEGDVNSRKEDISTSLATHVITEQEAVRSCNMPAQTSGSAQSAIRPSDTKQINSTTEQTLIKPHLETRSPLEIIAALSPYYAQAVLKSPKAKTSRQRMLEKTPTKKPPPLKAIKPKSTTDRTSHPTVSPFLEKIHKSPKRAQLQKQARSILPKGFIMESKVSPTKIVARGLKRRAQMFAQRSSPCKLLPKTETQRGAVSFSLKPRETKRKRTSSRKKQKKKTTTSRLLYSNNESDFSDEMSDVDEMRADHVRQSHFARQARKHNGDDIDLRLEESDDMPSDDAAGLSQDDSQTEDHIDDLMAASTTIRFNSKKQTILDRHSLTKAQKKREITLAMLAPDLLEADPRKDEKDTAFAQAYLNQAKVILKDNMDLYEHFLRYMHEFGKGGLPVEKLFNKVQSLFHEYPELASDFAAFLSPHQAVKCGCFMANQEFVKARTFLRKLEIYFEKQQSQFHRVLKAFHLWFQKPTKQSEELKESIQPLLKGIPHLLEEFSLFFPEEKPPESYLTDYEEITLNDSDLEADIEFDSAEEIEIPDELETYRTKRCRCDCHSNTSDKKLQKRLRHCYSCSLRVIDGKLYFQTSSKKITPVKITFHSPVTLPQKPGITHQSDEDEESDFDVADKENINISSRSLIVSPSTSSHASPAKSRKIKLKHVSQKPGQKRFMNLNEVASSQESPGKTKKSTLTASSNSSVTENTAQTAVSGSATVLPTSDCGRPAEADGKGDNQNERDRHEHFLDGFSNLEIPRCEGQQQDKVKGSSSFHDGLDFSGPNLAQNSCDILAKAMVSAHIKPSEESTTVDFFQKFLATNFNISSNSSPVKQDSCLRINDYDDSTHLSFPGDFVQRFVLAGLNPSKTASPVKEDVSGKQGSASESSSNSQQAHLAGELMQKFAEAGLAASHSRTNAADKSESSSHMDLYLKSKSDHDPEDSQHSLLSMEQMQKFLEAGLKSRTESPVKAASSGEQGLSESLSDTQLIFSKEFIHRLLEETNSPTKKNESLLNVAEGGEGIDGSVKRVSSHTSSCDPVQSLSNRSCHSVSRSSSETLCHSVGRSPSDTTCHSVTRSPSDKSFHSAVRSVSDRSCHSVDRSSSDRTCHMVDRSPSDRSCQSVYKSSSEKSCHSIDRSSSERSCPSVYKSLSDRTCYSVDKSPSDRTCYSDDRSPSDKSCQSVVRSSSEISCQSVYKSPSERSHISADRSSDRIHHSVDRSSPDKSCQSVVRSSSEISCPSVYKSSSETLCPSVDRASSDKSYHSVDRSSSDRTCKSVYKSSSESHLKSNISSSPSVESSVSKVSVHTAEVCNEVVDEDSDDEEEEDDDDTSNLSDIVESETSSEMDSAASEDSDQESSLDQKEDSVTWTREMDRVLILRYKMLGTVEDTCKVVSKELKTISPKQVAQRISQILSVIEDVEEDEDSDSS